MVWHLSKGWFMANAELASVSVAGMLAALPNVETAVTETSTAYSNMKGQATALGASWEGAEAEKFKGVLDAWLEHLSAIVVALRQIYEKLEAITHPYKRVCDAGCNTVTLHRVVETGLSGF
jgi:uncharacterized protein YukE